MQEPIFQPKEPKRYKIVYGNPEEVSEMVSRYLKSTWFLHGPLCVCQTSIGAKVYQAIVEV